MYKASADLAKTRASGLSLEQRRTELGAAKWTNPLQGLFVLHQILYPTPRYIHAPTPTGRHIMGETPLSTHAPCSHPLFSKHFGENQSLRPGKLFFLKQNIVPQRLRSVAPRGITTGWIKTYNPHSLCVPKCSFWGIRLKTGDEHHITASVVYTGSY